MKGMGYDDDWYSLKSRIFVATVHSEIPITVQIGDALESNINQRASNLAMHKNLQDDGLNENCEEKDGFLMFKMNHSGCKGCSFAVANKTSSWAEVELDMTSMKG
jgi:hypothetical protein